MLKRFTEQILSATLVLVFLNVVPTSVPASDTILQPRHRGSHRPVIQITPEKPTFSIMSITQSGLSADKIGQIDDFKKRMLDGTFQYEDYRQVSGLYHERSDTYFVKEGHHRLAAALEIAKERGDWSFFKKLIERGYWSTAVRVNDRKYPLPMRTGWNNFISCHFMLRRLAPSPFRLFQFE